MAESIIKDNFTAVPNKLLEAIYSFGFTITELRVVLAVIRYTYGYGKEFGDISAGFIAKVIQADRDLVAKCIRRLVKAGIIKVAKDATYTQSKQLGIQTDSSLWDRGVGHTDPSGVGHTDPSGVGHTDHAGIVHTDPSGVVHTDHTGIVHTDPSGIVRTDPHKINNKEIYKENYKENYKERDRIALGVHSNVYMTEEELSDLRRRFYECEKYIDRLSRYIENTKRNYPSHYQTLIDWMVKDGITDHTYSTFDPDEFFRIALEASERKMSKSD